MTNSSADLELPDSFERLTLIVVVEADETHERGVALRGGLHETFDQPLPVANGDDVALARRVAASLVGDEDGWRRRALVGAVRVEKARR